MHKIVLRLAAATAGVTIPLALATSAMAGTTSGSQTPVSPGVCFYGPIASDGSQVASQINWTSQSAQGGTAISNQIAPSLNLPVALLSPGANQGSVTQAPSSSASANASNTNTTTQTITQAQPDHQVKVSCSPVWVASQSASQLASQANSTSQQAQGGTAISNQVAPSLNLPVALLSPGANQGSVNQAPSSSASANASNTNMTTQGISQSSGGQGSGRGHCRHHHPVYSGQPQQAYQSNSTSQSAQGGTAISNQVAPSANLPVAVLSPGANKGSVNQAPSSSASANASNTNTTTQGISQSSGGQDQSGGLHLAGQSNSTSQQAQGGTAISNQVAPSLNLPVAVLSPGANDGSVNQAPSSSASANASNTNSTVQTITQTLGVLG